MMSAACAGHKSRHVEYRNVSTTTFPRAWASVVRWPSWSRSAILGAGSGGGTKGASTRGARATDAVVTPPRPPSTRHMSPATARRRGEADAASARGPAVLELKDKACWRFSPRHLRGRDRRYRESLHEHMRT